MDLSPYLGNDSKLNEVSLAIPVGARNGPDLISPRLGERFHLTENRATKLSNTLIGTLRQGVIQFVKTDPSIAVIANWQVGRPVFWSDMKNFVATTVAASTGLFAGIAINVPDKAGDCVFIYVEGDVGALYTAALTKAVPALGDPVKLSIAASLATVDVQLDATPFSNVELKLVIGKVNEAPVVNLVKRIILTEAVRSFNEGMM